MDNYHLAPNEGIILQCDGVYHGGKRAEIVLTNQNLICIEENSGAFKKTTYNTIKYPIRQIKIVNGQAQAFSTDDKQLQIFLHTSNEYFDFSQKTPKQLRDMFAGRREVEEWVNQINILLTGNTSASSVDSSLLGGIRNALGSVGINLKSNQPVNISSKCRGCMAPLSGQQGQIVHCKYCDTEQTL